MEQLSQYLRKHRIRQMDFAEAVGVTQGVISRLVSGTVKPSLDLAVRIERATGGVVPVHAWVALIQSTDPDVGGRT